MGGYRSQQPEVLDRCYHEVYQMLADGEIDPLISQRIAMPDLPAGLKSLADRTTTGRLVIDPAA